MSFSTLPRVAGWLLLPLLAACQSVAPESEFGGLKGKSSMLSEQHMRDYFRTYNSEDPDALRAYYADDVAFETAQGTQIGVAPILATYRYLIDHFYDRMEPESIRIDGDQAVVDIVDTFTAKKPVDDFMGQAFVTGQRFVLKIRGTYRYQHGRFTHVTIEMR